MQESRNFPTPVPLVINLLDRPDRLEEVSNTLKTIGLSNWRRIDAIYDRNGALGCALSHLKALEEACASESECFIIFEDDVIPSKHFSQADFYEFLEEFLSTPKFAVMCLAYSTGFKGMRLSANLLADDDMAMAAAYVIKKDFIPNLRDEFSKSVYLLEHGVVNRVAAIDIRWKRTQKNLIFVRPFNPLFIQKPGWSNIENRNVDYS